MAGAIVGHGVTSALSNVVIPGAGTTTTFTGYLKGIITGVSTDTVNGNSTIDVKIVSQVSSTGTETRLNYQQSNAARSFEAADGIKFVNNVGVNTGNGKVTAAASAVDWYEQQTLGLSNSVVYWKSLAPKPVDSNFSASRSGKNDSIHVVVVDDQGTVTGSQGTILEKFLSLSKAKDATADASNPTRTYYKDFIALNSNYIYAGYNTSQAVDAFHGTSPLHPKLTDSRQDIHQTQLVQVFGDKMHRELISLLLEISHTPYLVVLIINLVVVWPLHLVD